MPLRTGDAQRRKLAAVNVAGARGVFKKQHLDLPADQIGDRIGDGLVRHAGHRRAGFDAKQFRSHQRGRVVVSVKHLARIGLRGVDQRRNRIDRAAGRYHRNRPERAKRADVLEILDRVVRQLLVQADIGGMGAVGREHQGVAVRRGVLGKLGADNAVGARLVFDHH